ncbi:MAG: enoyl-CoA hydratase-related protein [Gammaproteobacteria bacterium]|jgi:enoyl-CoA hydratase/carnithine racemase|nr:enoyl-CoA hydratase-related protein [Gammaproteobacteria bacterium]HJP03747.1 enoyl-CoA hydratase-related protein [Gammaproteobacteria bacterium]
MMQFIEYSLENHVARITINRPQVRNALNPETYYALSQVCDQVEQDDDVWLAVITGAGDKAFSAGRDLKQMAEINAASEAEQLREAELWKKITRLTDRHYFPKPIIARLNGSAYGGGLEIALACDIIVASEDARIGLPEPRRGLIPFAGGVHRLPRQIPLKKAMGYLLTGRDMSAAEALELGLINEVVPADRLDEAVDSWVLDILKCAPLAIRAIKQCVMEGLDYSLAEAMAREYKWETRRQASDDSAEGPRAFAEKREPRWTGR